jgi:kinesin family protein 2/24
MPLLTFPLLPIHHSNRGDYDIISIDNVGQTSSDSEDTICVDSPLMHPDMKQKLIKPMIFTAQAAFDEHCSDDDVYRNIAEPLINSVIREGVVSTILLYGQTGCGKSYTISGIEERTARGIFSRVNNTGQISLQFVELCGNKEINDLLSSKNKEAVKLVDDEDGSCRMLNATSITISSSQQLLDKMKEAKSRRSTEATDKNGMSSRSHAVCQIRITGTKGVLTLIDLAGSERRHDSLWHSKERQQESAEINASLFALKECVRARASNNSRVPFRNHSLTRILRESFERDGARLCVIACISPNATDTEHTMETLRFAASIVGKDAQIREGETRLVETAIATNESSRNIQSPKQWDNERLQKFLLHKKMDRVRLTEKHDGKALMKMSVPQMKSQLFDDKDSEQAKKLFNLLRLENDRVASIQRADRIKLSKARKGQS